jgi:hypothetical protein
LQVIVTCRFCIADSDVFYIKKEEGKKNEKIIIPGNSTVLIAACLSGLRNDPVSRRKKDAGCRDRRWGGERQLYL